MIPPLLGGEGRGEDGRSANPRGKLVFLNRPHPDLLPQEKEQLLFVSILSDDCPANPAARIFKETANDSPSPWRRGPG